MKKMVFKFISWIKSILGVVFSFFLGSRGKKKENSLKEQKKSKEEKKRFNIKGNSDGHMEAPSARGFNKAPTFVKTNEELKDTIKNIYLLNLGREITEISEEDKVKLRLTEEKVLPLVRNKIEKSEIRNDKELHTEIIKEIREEQDIKLQAKEEELEVPENLLSEDVAPIANMENDEKQDAKNTQNIGQNNNEVNVISTTKYTKKKKINNYYVATTKDGYYVLIDDLENELSAYFKSEIVDYRNNYLKVKDKDKYYIYKFNGEILENNEYLDINLDDDFYVVIDSNRNLDIHKYENKKFRLSEPIKVSYNDYQNDYEVKNNKGYFEIKLRSTNEKYYADSYTGVLENKKEKIDAQILNIPFVNISSKPLSSKTVEDAPVIELVRPKDDEIEELLEVDEDYSYDNTLEEQQREVIDNKRDEEKTDKVTIDNKEQEVKKTEEIQNDHDNKSPKIEEQEEKYEVIDLTPVARQIDEITFDSKIEVQKEDLEDKNYDYLEEKINYLLLNIANKKKYNLRMEDRQKLDKEEKRLISLRNNLGVQKERDIQEEQFHLDQEITMSELYNLEMELRNIHLEKQIEFNKHNIKNAENLSFISKEQADRIEKELLKDRLKNANRAVTITSLLALPFIRNKYFLYFTAGMIASSHLKIFHNILEHKTEDYQKEDISYIRKGANALDEALNKTNDNLEYLEQLEFMASEKFPELKADNEYLLYLNSLKTSLLEQEAKMLKKKKMIEKYNLRKEYFARKLKKKNKVA